MAIIAECKCKNDYQDEVYGKNRRVMNKMGKEDYYRCTSCAATKCISSKKIAEAVNEEIKEEKKARKESIKSNKKEKMTRQDGKK